MSLERQGIVVEHNINFIIPENDINLRLSRLLVIINELAFTQRGKLVINIDKLTIFDFLVRNPFLLKNVLKVKSKTNLKLLNEEFGSIASMYPSNLALVETTSTKTLIKILVSYDMLTVIQDEGELYYILSDKGKSFISEIETDYIVRMKELCKSMLVLRSVSTNDLKKIINPVVKGI